MGKVVDISAFGSVLAAIHQEHAEGRVRSSIIITFDQEGIPSVSTTNDMPIEQIVYGLEAAKYSFLNEFHY